MIYLPLILMIYLSLVLLSYQLFKWAVLLGGDKWTRGSLIVWGLLSFIPVINIVFALMIYTATLSAYNDSKVDHAKKLRAWLGKESKI